MCVLQYNNFGYSGDQAGISGIRQSMQKILRGVCEELTRKGQAKGSMR